MKVEIEREADRRWIAEIPAIPGVMAYGDNRNEAVSKVETLALRAVADRLEYGEEIPVSCSREIRPKMLARIAKHTGLISKILCEFSTYASS